MSVQNSNVLKKKTGAFRKVFILTTICVALFVWSSFAFYFEASGLVAGLGKLNFQYPSDGSIKIELNSDIPIGSYQIKTIANKTIVQMKGARALHHLSYLVRNSFDVEVQTAAKDFDGEPGVELTITAPRGATVVPTQELNKIYFLVSLNTEPKTSSALPIKTKETRADNPYVVVKNYEKTFSMRNQQGNGSISGQVKDELGDVIVDAEVVITDKDGKRQSVKTDQSGIYRFSNLAPGKYTLKVKAPNFVRYENNEIEITNKPHAPLDIALKVNFETQVVTVGREAPLSSDLGNNINGIVLGEEDLSSLPEDPQGLAMALQGLAAASGNQLGGEVIVDGFPGGRIPPKKAIREIRINKNPYSAEFNRPGSGRIEILTKPGMEEFNGGASYSFNNNRLNTRDPFAADTLPYQSNNYGFYLGGPIKTKPASFFFNFEKGKTNSNNLINATILDSNLNIVPFNSSVSSPQRYTNFTPRVDIQLDDRNTLVSRYSYAKSSSENSGVGGFSLLSRAFNTSSTEHSIQLTETFVFNPRMVAETRSLFVRRVNNRQSNNFGLSIDVPGAFNSGASFDSAFNKYNRLDVSNVTTISRTNHTIRAGGGFRYVGITDSSSQGFGGTYRFDGLLAPRLNSNNAIVYNSNGTPLLVPISGLERYRRTVRFAQLGFSPQQIRELGGGASQFTITKGEKEAKVRQYSLNAFVQDDWRLRPNFSLGLGLRFESQSNINRNLTFAPRVSFAWSKMRKSNESSSGNKGEEQVNFVLRGGVGFFYEGFGENFTLRANRLNGINQRQYIVTDPAVLNLFPQIPAEGILNGYSTSATLIRIDPNLRLPLSIQSNFSFEKQLPFKLILSTNYLNVRTINALRSRFINSSASNEANRTFQYESTGKFNQNQLSFTVSRRLSNSSFYATYSLNKAKSDTDGPDFFPLNSSNFETDYGRAASDVRHNLYIGGWIRTLFDVDVNPLIIYRSGVPYNITLGRDLNGDTILNDRPAFATDFSRPSVVITSLGAFDLDPIPGQTIIPRNYGTSPNFLSVNLNVSKTFTFFGETDSQSGDKKANILGIPVSRRPLYFTFSVQIENLLNRTNPYLPEGNLSSPFFGQSYFSAGSYGFGGYMPANRIIKPSIIFSF